MQNNVNLVENVNYLASILFVLSTPSKFFYQNTWLFNFLADLAEVLFDSCANLFLKDIPFV